MSGVSLAGAALPAVITSPTAWAAFKYVFNADSWSLRFPPDGSDALDIQWGEEFTDMLAGVDARSYSEQARAVIGMRLMELAAEINPLIVRHCRREGDLRALEILRRQIKSKIRDELTARYSIEKWQQNATDSIHETLIVPPGAVEYLGLDQVVDYPTLDRAIKYLFQRCELRVQFDDDAAVLCGNYKLDDIRASTSDDDRTVAWQLVVRFVEATLRSTDVDWLNTQNSASLIPLIHSKVREVAVAEGAWGLIHATLRDTRAALGLDASIAANDVIADLVAVQDNRLRSALGLEPHHAYVARPSPTREIEKS